MKKMEKWENEKTEKNGKKRKGPLTPIRKCGGYGIYDLGSEQLIQTRSQVRLDLWAIHLRSPIAAVGEALRRTEDGAGRAHSSAAAGSET